MEQIPHGRGELAYDKSRDMTQVTFRGHDPGIEVPFRGNHRIPIKKLRNMMANAWGHDAKLVLESAQVPCKSFKFSCAQGTLVLGARTPRKDATNACMSSTLSKNKLWERERITVVRVHHRVANSHANGRGQRTFDTVKRQVICVPRSCVRVNIRISTRETHVNPIQIAHDGSYSIPVSTIGAK